MNVSFDDTAFRQPITARNTACGTITVAEQDNGGDQPTDDPIDVPDVPDVGGVLDTPLALGGIGVLVLIVVALLVI